MKRQLFPSRRSYGSYLVATIVALGAVALAEWPFRSMAQSQNERESLRAGVAGRPDDVKSIEAITAAVYDAISGPAGARDWDRLHSLFYPWARLIPCVRARKEEAKPAMQARVLTIDEYIKMAEPRLKAEGFFEREVARRVERFGSIAHVFSTYESRHAANDPEPFARGINSIQLFFDGTRWWTVTIFGDSERPDQEIPAEYLPKR